MNDDERDAVAKLRAAFDQFRETTKEVAANVATYHAALRANGIFGEDALQLTAGYQLLLMTQIEALGRQQAQQQDADPDA